MSREPLIGSIILLAVTALAIALHNIPNFKKPDETESRVSGLEKGEKGDVSLFERRNVPFFHPEQKFLISGPIDINSATIEDLEAIPRIGPSLAQRIIDFRTQRGDISDLNELLEVKGIGPRTLETIKPYLKTPSPPAGEGGGEGE